MALVYTRNNRHISQRINSACTVEINMMQGGSKELSPPTTLGPKNSAWIGLLNFSRSSNHNTTGHPTAKLGTQTRHRSLEVVSIMKLLE
jgi:hypothetical protein